MSYDILIIIYVLPYSRSLFSLIKIDLVFCIPTSLKSSTPS